MKSTVHKYDNIIIGSTLEALIYSYTTNYPVFFAGSRCPKEFEYFEPAMAIFPFEELTTKTIQTNDFIYEVGNSKLPLWENLIFCLSMAGLVPLADNASSIRFDSDGTIRLIYNNRSITIEAKQVYLFDGLGVSGLGAEKPVGNYKVYDWLFFNSLYPNPYDILKTEYDVASELWFLEPTNAKRFKDGCIISEFPTEKKMHENLTEYNIKFILKDLFKKYDIKGKANGVHHIDKVTQRYKQVQYTQIHREVSPPIYLFEEIDNIKVLDYNLEQLKDWLQPNPKVDKIWKNSIITQQE